MEDEMANDMVVNRDEVELNGLEKNMETTILFRAF